MDATLEPPPDRPDCADCDRRARGLCAGDARSLCPYISRAERARPPRLPTEPSSPSAPLTRHERRRALIEFGALALSAALLLAGWAAHLLHAPEPLRIALLVAAAALASRATFPEALRALRRFKLDVDVLMFVAAGGAALLGHWEEGAFLLWLFGLGAAGEDFALRRARSAVRALASLAPETAHLLRPDGSEADVPIENVPVGARIAVRPFERIPLDGLVARGDSSVDESTITGESLPVPKQPGDGVYAGTLNGDAPLVVEVTKPAGEGTLARIMRLVEEAQAERSPAERLTARVEAVYVPCVLAATVLLAVTPPLLLEFAGLGYPWGVAFYRSMAFLTAASPCALAIGTPAAVLCGLARAARLGVLAKGGGVLEALGRCRAFAFDKTGTLTLGRPAVASVDPQPGFAREDVLRLAAAAERGINHPLAEAVVRAAEDEALDIPEARDVRQITARGVEGAVGARRVYVGKRSRPRPAAFARAAELGQTAIAVEIDGRPAGVIALADAIRPEAAGVVARLREAGVRHVVMLTGDHRPAAEAIARQIGLDAVHADLLPEDKLRLIDALRGEHGDVAMVGDGVNDAPALARAAVGVAMGAAGNDTAMETADIALMGDTLARLPDALALSRATRRMIWQNVAIALGVIAVVAPLGAAGLAGLGVAVLLHEGSTVLVVLNSLRLLRWRPRRAGRATTENTEGMRHGGR